MGYSKDMRALACLRRFEGWSFSAIARSLHMARSRPALFWKEFAATGSFEPTKRARARRADCQLTLDEIDWIAERILDTPDLLISELRRVFVYVHPDKAFVSEYAIVQALIVRTFGMECRGGSRWLGVDDLTDSVC